jgi:adenine C2-methylase RlmN of 23S rRNA A2503 and tRNA A37
MSNRYRGHAIDASYQVSVHLTKQFQRKRLFRIDQPEKRKLLVAAMFVKGSGRNEQAL